MKNKILEIFKAYERETEWEGNAIPESMYDALANDIMKLYSKTKRIGIIGGGFQGIICGIDEARTVIIAHEHVVRYPDLPELDHYPPFEDKMSQDRYIGEILCRPEVIEQFKNMSLQTRIATESIKSLAEGIKEYDLKTLPKEKHKGYERPYKYHR